MRKPLIHSLLLSLVFLSSACGNAKFNGKGKKKDKKQADQVVVVEPPVTCQPGETCVVVNPGDCKAGEKDCPVTPETPTTPGTVVPPVDDCKDGKDCPVTPDPDCDEAGQNPGQNPGQSDGKTCNTDDNTDQNDPVQNK